LVIWLPANVESGYNNNDDDKKKIIKEKKEKKESMRVGAVYV
jgi:hypothetical protein